MLPTVRRHPQAPRRRPGVYGLEFLDNGRDLEAPPARHPRLWGWKPSDPDGILNPPDETSPEAVTNYSPGRRRQSVALLLGGDWDKVSARILDGLRLEGVKFFKLNWQYFMRRGRLTLATGRPGARLRVGPLSLDLRDVAAVHYDPPEAALSRPDPDGPASRLLRATRWKAALRELHAFTPGAVWLPAIPDRCGGEESQLKLAELALARRCGLDVPETLLTNSLGEARAFLRRGPALFREFSVRYAVKHGVNHYFRVAPADPDSPGLSGLPASPCVFQRRVEKSCDIRAVLIGRRLLACRIDSQASERTRLDWRRYDFEKVAWTKTTLPRRAAAGLRRLAAQLGLRLASFDLAEGHDGRLYFLEANRPGVYLWLREFAGLDVSREIARCLARIVRRRGYSSPL